VEYALFEIWIRVPRHCASCELAVIALI